MQEFIEKEIIEEETQDENIEKEIIEYSPDMVSIHSKISQEAIPRIGMEFMSEDSAYDFYKGYAKMVGFGTRLSKCHKDKGGIILDRIFCCSSQGTREKDKRSAYVKKHRAETRCGCLALMKISRRVNGRVCVIKFEPCHNHVLASPSKTHLFRAHRQITPTQATELDMACSSGITPKGSMELMSRKAGGREHLGFLHMDCDNYLRTKRSKEMQVGDTGGVLEYLQRKQTEDPKFFYAIQVDIDDLITNIFWADAQMMSDYDYFGDVVCFDTTYKKNKEGRPFALLVGVNHHRQTTIFGAALLYDETTETFKWLFNTFVKAMHGKRPRTILTDQDQAMASALSSQWPDTYHRLCIWHIYQNAAKHLHHVFEEHKYFARDFSSCVYDHEYEDDFLNAWAEMLKRYNLTDNDWLKSLFTLREKWALVYGRQTFCADMNSTQRSESMNSQIKRYISYKNHLLQFFQHFERLLDDRRYSELIADFKTMHSSPALPYPVQILKHAATIYTPEVFELFQLEIWKAWDCVIEDDHTIGTTYRYKIIPPRKKFQHSVIFDPTVVSVSCSCKKFEFVGILCSHALKVLCSWNVITIPNQYILKRWRKNAKVKGLRDKKELTIPTDSKLRSKIWCNDLDLLFTHFTRRAAQSEETYKFALDIYDKSLAQVEASLKQLSCENFGEVDTSVLDHGADAPSDILEQCDNNATKVRGIKFKEKGRGKGGSGRGRGRGNGSTRFKSALEKGKRNKKPNISASNGQEEGGQGGTNLLLQVSQVTQLFSSSEHLDTSIGPGSFTQ